MEKNEKRILTGNNYQEVVEKAEDVEEKPAKKKAKKPAKKAEEKVEEKAEAKEEPKAEVADAENKAE